MSVSECTGGYGDSSPGGNSDWRGDDQNPDVHGTQPEVPADPRCAGGRDHVDDVVNPKPHPEPVLKALEQLEADPATTLMVGDSPVDMISAVKAGVIPVGVAWSLKEEALLWEAGARYMLKDMRDLYEIVGLERKPLAKN